MNSVRITRLAAVVLLAAIAAHRYATARTPPGMEQYNRAVRESADRVPRRIGSWIGEDVKVPVQALSVLKPNMIVSRSYVNVENGLSAGVLLEHCADAHQMVGHYPLRCYPADGWTLLGYHTEEVTVNGQLLRGTEYRFSMTEPGTAARDRSIIVFNCLLRPGGKVLPDMDALSRSIVGAAGPSYGAGQVQIYFDAGVPEAARAAALEQLLGGCTPVLEAILSKIPGAP